MECLHEFFASNRTMDAISNYGGKPILDRADISKKEAPKAPKRFWS